VYGKIDDGDSENVFRMKLNWIRTVFLLPSGNVTYASLLA